MRMRWFLLLGVLVTVASCVPMTDEMPKKQLTERQRDSLIGVSDLPGASVVQRSLAISDQAARRAARMDAAMDSLPK
jgi:hypothetical protein